MYINQNSMNLYERNLNKHSGEATVLPQNSDKTTANIASATTVLVALACAPVLSGCKLDTSGTAPANSTSSISTISKPVKQPAKPVPKNVSITPQSGEASVNGSCYKVFKPKKTKKGGVSAGEGSSPDNNLCDQGNNVVAIKKGEKLLFWTYSDDLSVNFGTSPVSMRCWSSVYSMPPTHSEILQDHTIATSEKASSKNFAGLKMYGRNTVKISEFPLDAKSYFCVSEL